MSKSLKKLVEESREKNQPEVDMSDRGISNMLDVNGLCKFSGRVFPLEPPEGLQFFQVAAGRGMRGCKDLHPAPCLSTSLVESLAQKVCNQNYAPFRLEDEPESPGKESHR